MDCRHLRNTAELLSKFKIQLIYTPSDAYGRWVLIIPSVIISVIMLHCI
jgi:hypothetical protein